MDRGIGQTKELAGRILVEVNDRRQEGWMRREKVHTKDEVCTK